MHAGTQLLILLTVVGVGAVVVYKLYGSAGTAPLPNVQTPAANTAAGQTQAVADSANNLSNALAGLASEFSLAGLT